MVLGKGFRFSQKMVKVVSINGNIACGKSTLLRALKGNGYEVVMEGLNRGEWGNVLELYYENPKRYGYLFQTLVIAEMKETYRALRKRQDEVKQGVVFVERSHIDCLAFATLVHKNKDMSDVEFKTFLRIYNLLEEKPDVIMFLDLSPEICFERCKARGRECESGITLSYLAGVDKCTRQLVFDKEKTSNGVPVMKLDVLGKSTSEIVSEVESILQFSTKRRLI